jgi:SulP family sulfate permease
MATSSSPHDDKVRPAKPRWRKPAFLAGVDLAPFRPRLVSVLKDYNRDRLIADIGAGLTVGIVALPLAMAFAIASGVKPEAGLFTAIIAGFIISALGGSQVQIGGPAGAFIVIVYGIVQKYGLANLLISTVLAGGILFSMGLFRLGALVRYIPVSIVIGFTNGIAVLIALSQVKDLLGLSPASMPADFVGQIRTIGAHLHQFDPFALALGAITLAGLFLWPRLFAPKSIVPKGWQGRRAFAMASRMPAPMIVLVLMTAATAALELPVATIGSRFGGIPQGLPSFGWPDFSWDGVRQLFMPTLTIALLGAIESLLCARVADNMSDFKRHDPNQELMAQGIANIVTPFFGGIPATGTIARTVTNVRAGATSPVAGIVHALTLLLIVLVAAPLAMHIPLAVLAGILLFVAWNMGEWHEFARLRQFNYTYRTILLGTFFLTVVFDLTVAVQVGLVLACVFFIYRMSTLFRIEPATGAGMGPVELGTPSGVSVWRLYGSLFFGAVGKVEELPDRLPESTRMLVLELHRLVSIDTSGLDALVQLRRTLARRDIGLILCEVNDQPLGLIHRSGHEGLLGHDKLAPDLTAALTRARQMLGEAEPSGH